MTLTPAMQQYHDIKKEYSDAVIFFRMGDFYEMFGEDAHIAHKVLGINITSRNKNAKDPEALAGIPYHAKDKYLPMLIGAGYKVAIVEQVSDPKLKGIVKREVVRVVTPATLNLEGDMYDHFDNNIILSIVKLKDIFGLSVLDIATGKWQTADFMSFESLQKELFILSPKEVVLDKVLFQDASIKEVLQKKYALNIYYFEMRDEPYTKLIRHFGVKNLSGFGIEKMSSGIASSALLLSYLELNQKTSLTLLDTISAYSQNDFLQIDSATLRNLDLVFNFSTGSELGSLFSVLNQTKTPMGKRFLKENILRPLQDQTTIQKRLDFIEAFLQDKILLDRVREKLSYVSDIDAILNRLALQRVSPRDLLNLKRSLQAILEITQIIETSQNQTLIGILK